MSGRVRRVFLGLTEVSGHYVALAGGLRALGVAVTYVNLTGHPFGYGGDDPVRPARWYRRVAGWRRGRGGPARLVGGLALLAIRLALLGWAVVRFDAFVFGFNTSFLHLYDLPLLRLLGKRVVFQFHGSDSRPPYMDGGVVPAGGEWDPVLLAALTRRKRRTVRWIDRWADAVIDNPTSGHFHTRPIVNWLRVGLPAVPPAESPEPPPDGPVVRLLHCPSHPAVKGTDRVRAAVEAAAGDVSVELRTVTNVPNAEVRRAIDGCDVVLDQAYSDYAMPGLATEAAWHGRPVVIGGYAARLWDAWLPLEDRPPTRFVTPDRLAEAIRGLAADAAARAELGKRAHEFVATRWHPEAVAARVLRVLDGGAPAAWLFQPGETNYVHGCGLPAEWAAAVGRRLVDAFGPGVLGVADKPALERRLLAFYRGEES